jgi:hypothetical protein
MLKEERIAICSHFGCGTIKKVKPLKFRSLGFRKYPKCSKHKLSLVFVDEFIEQFISSVNSCLFDISSLPPKDLVNYISKDAPEELKLFINVWMYCSPIGRGAQVVSRYLDGLSKGYIKLLSRKQRNAIQGGKKNKESYNLLRQGLKKVAEEYTLFLQELHTRSQDYCDLSNVQPLSKKISSIIKNWRNKQTINNIKIAAKINDLNDISILKKKYDDILNLRTASLILGKTPTEKISAFELFSAYFEFSKEGLCSKIKRETIQHMINIQENDTANLNNKVKAFPIKAKKQLYIDKEKKLKQCSHCSEILPFKEFSYITHRGKKRLRHICNKCKNISSKKQYAISKMKTKLFLLENLGNACICKKDMIEILPAISFHHPTDKKSYTWSEGKEKGENQEIILNKLKSDHTVPLCENCHRLETASLFRKYNKLILLEKLFNNSAEDIIALIENQIKHEDSVNKTYIRKYLKRWIRKRYIIEKIFEGKCNCCGETVKNNLPAFAMHHLERNEESSRWKDISDNDCEEIFNIIFNEKIIFICANCHRIVHSVFHQYVEEILENYSNEYVKKIRKKANERYNELKSILEAFRYKLEKSDIKSPLKVYTFSSQDAWKLYLLQFYYIMKKLRISSFRRKDFTQFFHINLRNVTNWIPKLLEKDYLKMETPTVSQYQYYALSNNGLKMIQKIEKEHKEEAQREYEKIFSSGTDPIIRPLRYRVFMKVHNYPKIPIGELIKKYFAYESEKSVRNYHSEARKYFSKK